MSKKQEKNPYFGNNIRLLRLKYDMSQKEFAIALDVATPSDRSRNLSSMISGWERGDREPSLQTLCKIARRFGVTTDWILGVEENSNSDFGREAHLLLLKGEKNISEEDKKKLLKIIEAFTKPNS